MSTLAIPPADVRVAPPRRAAAGVPARRRRVPWALAAVAVVVVVRVAALQGSSWSDDEGTYYSQALSFITRARLAPYTYWYDHPPVGWVQIAPLVGLLHVVTDPWTTMVSARLVMVLYAAATAGMLYAVARALRLGVPAAVATVLVWGLSPLAAQLSGQLYLDNVGVPWVLAALWLALRRHDLFPHLLSGAVLAVAVLTKETFVLALPGVVWALVASTHRVNRVFSLVGFALTFTLSCLAYPLLAANRGELLVGPGHTSLEFGIRWQLGERLASGSVLDPGSVARTTVAQWLAVDPVLPVAGLAACLVCLAVPRLRALGVVVAVMVLVGLRPSGYLPLMYVVGLLPFFALGVVAVAETVVVAALRPARRGRHDPAHAGDGPVVPARPRRVLPALAVVAAAVVVALTAQAWLPVWRTNLLRPHNEVYRQALAYVDASVPRDAVIVTDNVFYDDLVAAGRPDDGWHGPLWFPKYELDPDGARQHGITSWRQVDYVVSSAIVRAGEPTSENVRELVSHTTLVRSIGSGGGRVDVLRVDR